MKNIFAGLFCTIWAIVGFWLGYTNYDILKNVHAAQSWIETPAKLVSYERVWGTANTSTTRGSKKTSRLDVEYTYSYSSGLLNTANETDLSKSLNTRNFTGTKVDFSYGSNNFSNKRQARQTNLLKSDNLTVWVNPENPSESVVDPTPPMEYLAFTSAFIFFPCFIGILFFFGFPAMFSNAILGPDNFMTKVLTKLTGYLSFITFCATPVYALFFLTEYLTFYPTLVFIIVLIVVGIMSFFIGKFNTNKDKWVEKLQKKKVKPIIYNMPSEPKKPKKSRFYDE